MEDDDHSGRTADERLADLVVDRWKRADQSLAEDRRHYWLNYAFYCGHQWIAWDTRRNVVVNFSTVAGDDTSRVRITANKMRERINQLLGRFTQRNLAFEGQPSASDDATINGARLGEAILEDQRTTQGWEGVREETVFNALMGATAAVVVEWDTKATANLWVDSKTSDVKGEGNAKLIPLSIAEFSLQPGTRRAEDAVWWVGCTAVPPAQAKAKYGLKWTPDADASSSYSPLQRDMMHDRGVDRAADLCAVYVMYERPNPGSEEGRKVAVINGKVVAQGKWDFPFTDRLNIEVFHQQRLPMRWTGTTIVTDARPIQLIYNQALSSIVEAAKLCGNPRLLVPIGALDDETELTDEMGEIVRYYQEMGELKYLQAPDIPVWLRELPVQCEDMLDGILHTHAVSRGEAPGDRNSGLALSILAEKNDTPLGPMARSQANGWSSVGSMVLKLYEARASKKRQAVVRSEDGVANRMEWNGQRLQGQTTVLVPLDATLPASRTATHALLANLAAQFPQLAASLDTGNLLRVMDIPGTRILGEINDADVAFATRENHLMASGEPRVPRMWDDHAKHLAEHNRYRKSKSYDGLTDEGKEIFRLHLEGHQRMVEEELQNQARLNALNPGFAGMPQADAPIGSAVPPDAKSAGALGMAS
jgi:hypothetical protein